MVKKILLLILLLSTISFHSYSQISEDRLKANILFFIADYFTWPTEIDTLTIGFYGDKHAISDEILRVAKIKKIKGKSVEVREISKLDEIKGINLLFICDNYTSDMAEIFPIATENSILLISEYQKNNLYTMINFVSNEANKKKIAFELNKQNITSAKLTFKNELLLYGGTEVDIKNLYRDIQKLLDNERQNVADLQKINNLKQLEIAERNNQIITLENSINNANQLFASLNDTILIQRQNVELRNAQIQSQISDYNQIQERYQKVFTTSENLNQQIATQTERLKELDLTIGKREGTIKEQSAAIVEKEIRLQKERMAVYLFSIVSLAFLIIGVMLYRANRLKRRNNMMLEQKVEERTQELQSTNEHLLNEIVERQKFEQELILSARNYREIFNATSEAIFIHDASNGAILDVNDTMLHLYGFQRKDLAKLRVNDICAGLENYNSIEADRHFKRAIDKGYTTYEWYARKKNNTIFWVEIALKSTEISGKKIVLAVVRDIDEKKKISLELDNYRKNLEALVKERTEEVQFANTELEDTIEELSTVNENLEKQKLELEVIISKLTQAQQQLLQSEKLASLGVFTAGIAHEINNPVNFISSGSTALFEMIKTLEDEIVEKNPHTATIFEDIAITQRAIETGVERTTAIISSLRNYARSDDKKFVSYNVINCINDTLLLLHNTYKYHVVVEKLLPESLNIECIPGRINQLFVNIINNATQAIETNGKLIIKAKITVDSKAEFEIIDNGKGMEQALADKIFDPFFTTKEVGKGTGLGLYIVHGIIEEHNGKIEVNTVLGEGTSFKITLPLLQC